MAVRGAVDLGVEAVTQLAKRLGLRRHPQGLWRCVAWSSQSSGVAGKRSHENRRRFIGMHEVNDAITIRPAGPKDQNVIVQFNQALAIETEGKTLPDAIIREGVRRLLADKRLGLYFMGEIEGVIVGQTMVTTEWSDWRNGLFWWIQSVYVSPEFRRRGVFRALHAAVREAARRSDDVCGLRLYVYENNARAMEAYLNMGMERTHYAMFEEDWHLETRD